MKYPLTLRGTLAMLGGAYLIIGPARVSADLVAGFSGIIICLFTISSALINLILWRKIQSAINFKPKGSGERVLSLRPERIVTTVSNSSVPPFYELITKLDWQHQPETSLIHRIRGKSKKERILIEDVKFPHRGNWQALGVRCSLQDMFGLSAIKWTAPLYEATFSVAPNGDHEAYIPVLTSSERIGDDIHEQQTRAGDPYDLKPYHPADGARRILWKLFAKSGALYSRLPEPAMTPEGRVAIFVLAGSADDNLCVWALEYINKLTELSLEVFVGCSGMAVKGSAQVARNASAAEELFISSVWDSPWQQKNNLNGQEHISAIELELDQLASQIPQEGSKLVSTIVFVSKKSLQCPKAAEALGIIGQHLEIKGIQPVFCIEEGQGLNVAQDRPLLNRIVNTIFMKTDPTSTANGASNLSFPNFLTICNKAGWQVIV